MSAFITGSHAYGVPRPDSDIDIVILLPWDDYKILCKRTWDETYVYGGGRSDPTSLRIKHGKVDLIITGYFAFFQAWQWANSLLKKEQLVSRERAVEVIKGCLESAGMAYNPKEVSADTSEAEKLLAEAMN